jgi:hypothetical protein
MHPLGDVVNAVLRAGLRLEWLHEHPAIGWRLFDGLRRDADGLYRWPDRPWLPLDFRCGQRGNRPKGQGRSQPELAAATSICAPAAPGGTFAIC